MRVERLQSLVARLHALPRRRLTLMVGVDGRAAAGKTTFTRALGALDPGLDVIEMLDFALPAAERLGEGVEPAGRAAAGVDWRRPRSSGLLAPRRGPIAPYQRDDAGPGAQGRGPVGPGGGGRMLRGGVVVCEGPGHVLRLPRLGRMSVRDPAQSPGQREGLRVAHGLRLVVR